MGTFGRFNVISGVALLLASLTAGVIWERFGPGATFFAGAAITMLGLLATVGLVGTGGRRRSSGPPPRGQGSRDGPSDAS